MKLPVPVPVAPKVWVFDMFGYQNWFSLFLLTLWNNQSRRDGIIKVISWRTRRKKRSSFFLSLSRDPYWRDISVDWIVKLSYTQIIFVNDTSVHIAWLTPLGSDPGCDGNDALHQYAASARSSHHGVRWSPHQATGWLTWHTFFFFLYLGFLMFSEVFILFEKGDCALQMDIYDKRNKCLNIIVTCIFYTFLKSDLLQK